MSTEFFKLKIITQSIQARHVRLKKEFERKDAKDREFLAIGGEFEEAAKFLSMMKNAREDMQE